MPESRHYPEVPQYPVVQQFNTPEGVQCVEDEYAWLIQRDNPEVQEVIEAQNRHTTAYMEATDLAETLAARIDELNKAADVRSVTEMLGDKRIWCERSSDQEQLVIAMSDTDSDESHIIVDPNKLGENVSLSWHEVPAVGQHFLYALQYNGDGVDHVYVYNVATGESELFTSTELFNVAWDDAGEGFVYSRSNGSAHGDTMDPTSYQQLYYHQAGTDKDRDVLIFDAHEQGLSANAWLSPMSMSGRYVVADVWFSKMNIKPYLIDADAHTVQPLAQHEDGAHRARLHENSVYIMTTHNADNRQVLRSPIESAHQPLDAWESVLPEDPEKTLLQYAFTKDYIVAEYSHAIASEIQLRDQVSGQLLGNVPIPALSSIKELSTNHASNTFEYKIANFMSQGMTYKYDGVESHCTWADSRSLDPAEYEVQQEWFEAEDGVMVPATLICKRGLLRQARRKFVLQDQYGGFANGNYPDSGFTTMRRVWLEHGGTVALPNIRGGNEFGTKWHTNAIGKHKTKSIDDTVACAKYLKETGAADKVALSGGSNGGLVVLAAMLRAPDTIDAVDSRVPLSDMLNYTRYSPKAKYWKPEYGDPDVPEEFTWLAEYSPYHHVDTAESYRAILTAGLHDKLVDPIHSMKMAARLQRAGGKTLLLLDGASGHGPGRGLSHMARVQGMRLAFLMREMDFLTE